MGHIMENEFFPWYGFSTFFFVDHSGTLNLINVCCIFFFLAQILNDKPKKKKKKKKKGHRRSCARHPAHETVRSRGQIVPDCTGPRVECMWGRRVARYRCLSMSDGGL